MHHCHFIPYIAKQEFYSVDDLVLLSELPAPVYVHANSNLTVHLDSL